MFKKLIILTALLLFTVFSIQVQAHTKLVESTPGNGEIVTESLDTFKLSFATKIELTSTFEVVGIDGKPVKMREIHVSEKEMTGTADKPLNSGEYKVVWNIIGADGHPIKGEYVFAVVAQENTTQTEDPNKNEESVEQAPAVEQEGEVSENESPSFIIPVVVILLSAIAVGFLWWLLRRK